MKIRLLLPALLGLALATCLIGLVGFRPVLGAVKAIGWPGFALFCLYWLVVITVLGLAWFAVAPGLRAGQAATLIWGRLLREAASDILPFSQIGGLVIGARGVITLGIGESLVFASTIIDLTTELAAQLVYTAAAVGVLAWKLSHGPGNAALLWGSVGGLAIALAATVAFAAAQRRGVGVVGWLAKRWLPDTVTRAEAVRGQLDLIYRRPGRLLAGVCLHGLGWVASGVGSWMALRFMGVETPLWAVLTVESLMYALRSAAFFVPGAIGVQEGSYLLVGPLFGLPAETALALSLLKRGRDLLIGAPTLICWQIMEGRRLLSR